MIFGALVGTVAGLLVSKVAGTTKGSKERMWFVGLGAAIGAVGDMSLTIRKEATNAPRYRAPVPNVAPPMATGYIPPYTPSVSAAYPYPYAAYPDPVW